MRRRRSLSLLRRGLVGLQSHGHREGKRWGKVYVGTIRRKSGEEGQNNCIIRFERSPAAIEGVRAAHLRRRMKKSVTSIPPELGKSLSRKKEGENGRVIGRGGSRDGGHSDRG
jgi:hypothetical protein